MIYIVVFIFILLIIGLSQMYFNPSKESTSTRKSNEIFLMEIPLRISLFISFMIMWGMGGFRENVGVDYGMYSRNQIPRILSGEKNVVEPLATVIIKFGNTLGHSLGKYQYIFIIFHFIIMFFLFKAIINNSKNYFFSFALVFLTGFFNTSFNLMRQLIAISIFLFSIKYIYERKLIKYVIFVVLSILFHKTAILFLPIYWLYGVKFSIKRWILTIITVLISSTVIENILMFITSHFNIYRNYWGSREMSGYEGYSTVYWWSNLIILICMLYMYFVCEKTAHYSIKRLDMYIYIQTIPIIIMIFALVTYVPNFDRLVLMFSYVQILSIPEFFFSIKNSKSKIFICLIVIGIIFLSYIQLIYIKNIGDTFPYYSIFSK